MKLYKKIILANSLLLIFFSCKKENNIEPSNAAASIATVDVTATNAVAVALISDLKSGTSRTYQQGSLTTGTVYYTDRTYKTTSVPTALSGLLLIKTACDDKTNTTAQLTFTLAQTSTVYVAYDSRANALPTWLKSWTKTTSTIGVSDTKVSSLNVYSKDFAAGAVSLGANLATPATGVQCQYIVIIKANATATPVTSSSLVLGINVHSLNNEAYSPVSMANQMAMVKKMGMKTIRLDLSFNSDGTISKSSAFSQLYTAANANGISILAMVSPTTLNYKNTESQNYAAGKLLGSNVAAKNSKYFAYYELGNELDNKAIISGNGDLLTDYNASKLKMTAAFFKGMDDGIKSKQPTAKTMIDGSWRHFYFLQYMQTYGVKFDIVAWHWYSDMESAAASKIPDISLKLSSLFTKPIWFTEVGQRYKAVSNIDQIQSDFINAFTKKLKGNSQVKELLFYELFDEPVRSDAEGHFGFIKWTTPYTKWDYKIVAKSLFVD